MSKNFLTELAEMDDADPNILRAAENVANMMKMATAHLKQKNLGEEPSLEDVIKLTATIAESTTKN